MPIQNVFNTGLKVAKEDTYGVAPQSATNGDWFQGGRWIDIVTDGLPDLADRQATIWPTGHAGRRAMNNRAPVVGRKWSDGTFDFAMTSDFLGALLYGLMGSASANSVASTDFDLLNDEPVAAETEEQLVLATQPSDGGALLRIWVSGTSVGGSISIQGIDAHGNGASETLNWASAGSLYTRTSFSSIAPSGITVHSFNDAEITIQGHQYYDYVFTLNNTSAPTLSIERHGDPTAGATSIARIHTGMVTQSLTINTPAAQRDGLVTGSVQFEGNPTATSTATSLNDTSAVGVWPSWGMKITRDNENYYKLTDFSMTVNTGARNYRSAAGVQNPQGAFWGGFEATAGIQLLVDDENEFLRWQGASRQQYRGVWTSPWRLTSSQYQEMTASMLSAYFEGDLSPTEDEQAWSLGGTVRMANDGESGVISFGLKSNVPPSAYGL